MKKLLLTAVVMLGVSGVMLAQEPKAAQAKQVSIPKNKKSAAKTVEAKKAQEAAAKAKAAARTDKKD
ncbi:MAG: hypothetical protein JWQ27_3131 [Ferruginibacter sp.]|nr:hypothetical protein [Ferruginibacter sp.]